MRVAVGAPVANRAWILDRWFEHVEVAFARAGVAPEYVFVCGASRDRTAAILCNWKARWQACPQDDDQGQQRKWNPERYAQMVDYRNRLLKMVRESAPDFFLSLDSDILLHPDALCGLLETSQSGYDAVAGKLYLSRPPTKVPNYANQTPAGNWQRPDASGTFQVDIIMALKLMTPQAYNVDYEMHNQGEDFGWSIAARRNLLRLGWDGRFPSKHVMDPGYVGLIDPRLGY